MHTEQANVLYQAPAKRGRIETKTERLASYTAISASTPMPNTLPKTQAPATTYDGGRVMGSCTMYLHSILTARVHVPGSLRVPGTLLATHSHHIASSHKSQVPNSRIRAACPSSSCALVRVFREIPRLSWSKRLFCHHGLPHKSITPSGHSCPPHGSTMATAGHVALPPDWSNVSGPSTTCQPSRS